MTDKLRKYVLPNIPYVFIGWAFLKLGTAYRLAAGSDFAHKFIGLGQTVSAAFADFAPGLAPFDWLVGIVGAVAFRLLICFKSKNAKKFRRDEEYGSARWGSEKDIRPFVDPKFENNMILTATERLTMNTRPQNPANARNLNFCGIGSSGSGKTRFWLTPQLLQAHSSYSPPLPIETDRIHVANGTYFMDGSFTPNKSYCNNRLTVSYNPDAPTPKRWLQFLSELLQPEDIPTLQEFLGYCLLPTTKGQKMLMLIGKGGEGKSRIGLVMRSLLGDSMNTTSIQKVESNRFSRADLENKLLMVDDDMDMSALPKTNYIKSIVTSECKMDMERKGVQSYQSQLYVRFLCFGNGALTALHDKSDGFFRRQIVLTTKDRPAGRADDPFLVDKLLREKEGIFLWCLEGLHRLIGNDYQFTVSSKAKENMETVKRSSNNVIEFLQSEGYIRFRADSEASSKAIYEAYTRWCDDNAQKPMSANRVSSELAQK